MNDIVNIWVCVEDLVEASLICHVDFEQLRPLSANKLNTVQNLGRRVVEIICNDNLIVCFEECKHSERTNVSGSPTKLSLAFFDELWAGLSGTR